MPPTSVVKAPTPGLVKAHPAFSAIVKGKPGFYVWHVVKLELELVPEDQVGCFFTGDCYLILAVMDKDMSEMRIHFWIGEHCSIDEAAVAAMMAVALDDQFGGLPVQTREVQGAESSMFMQYFVDRKKALRYLDGGVESGLRHVTTPQHHNALYQVKGSTKACRITEVPITWDSMNEGDTFVLDVGAIIFVWKGKLSRTSESFAACNFANQLRLERAASSSLIDCIILVTEDGREESDFFADIYIEMWNKYLSLSKKKVKPATEGGHDEAVVKEQTSRLKLHCCKEQSGNTTITQVKNGPLDYADLKSDDAFIIDNGPGGVWAWIGKKASQQERRFAMYYATGFVQQNKYPASTRVSRVIDGAEMADFRSLFAKWPQPQLRMMPCCFNKIAKPGNETFDAKTLHANRKLAAESQMIDNGQGPREIYRVERKDGDRARAAYQLVKQDRAILYGGDCYVIVYTTEMKGTIIYYWIGRNSTIDERAACAALVVDMDNTRFHGQAMQVCVNQAKEPRHLMAIFGGLLTIFDGGKAGWTKGEQDKVVGDTYLLQIHCESRLDRKVIQVPLTAESLNSSDAFVLISGPAGKSFVWCGKGSLDGERQLGSTVAKTSLANAAPAVIVEGSETEDFWSAIGGKKPYASAKALVEASESFMPRLFQCTNRAGSLTVHEIAPFTQDDLVVDDVMLLDANDAIYIWIGKESNKLEREFALRAAADYLKTDPKGRDLNLPISVIKQGFEPPSFTGFFTAWDSKLWSQSKTYEQLKAEYGNAAKDTKLTAQQIEAMKKALGSEPDFATCPKFPYEKLTCPADQLPPEVDPSHREKYLAPDEFKRVMGMPYEQYATKSAWQRGKIKKTAKLF